MKEIKIHKDIVQNGNPTLREIAKEVPVEQIKTSKIQSIIEKMQSILTTQEDGVAIAAPQIGESLRIFVMSADVLHFKGAPTHTIYINPVIIKMSKDKKLLEEGCLSVRFWYGKIRRATKVKIEAFDQNGEKFTEECSGLFAQIFQHETDHLNGILFIDNAKNLREVDPKEFEK